LEAKRLHLLHQLMPQAQRIAVLVNPGSVAAETTLRDVEAGAHARLATAGAQGEHCSWT
jgi:ABC-type uncharacterized transport system substrate-binding protein